MDAGWWNKSTIVLHSNFEEWGARYTAQEKKMLLNSIFSTFKTMTRLFHLLPTTMPVAKPNDAFALFERHQPAIFHRDATAVTAAVVPLLPLQSGKLNVFEWFRQCLCTRVCVGKFMRNCN